MRRHSLAGPLILIVIGVAFLARNVWHTLQISVHGTNLEASLNGRHLLDYTLPEPVSGKVGVWSKTDSVIYYDDFTVSR